MVRVQDEASQTTAGQASSGTQSDVRTQRLVSIDALRGFDMFWIVGGQELALAVARLYSDPPPAWLEYQLEHVDWVGFSAWDLIMPLFLFVVGAAMPFSFARRIDEGESKAELYAKMLRRFGILFLLGMIVQGHLLDFKLSTLHLYANTLQAIAVGYLVSGIVMLNMRLFGQILVTALLLVGYWLLLTYVPVPGHGPGVLEPNANLALSVDEFVLGRFRDGTTYTWILSGMTFTATVMLGVFAGHVLRSKLASGIKFLALALMGAASLAGGWAWSEFGGFPIIKHIWTSSMVLWAGGWSYLLLALFYFLIDVAGLRRWAFPFVVIGMNAITIYVANWFIPFDGISETLVGRPHDDPAGPSGLAGHLGAAGPVLIAFTAVLLAWLLLHHLYRQKIFLRI